MTPDGIRNTTQIETGKFKTQQDAVLSAGDFWLREIAAQLAEANVYLQHQAAGISNLAAQLEVINQKSAKDEQQKAKAKAPIVAASDRAGFGKHRE